MWSGPRNLSTALMRSFENRNDTFAYDNESPSGYKELLPFQLHYDFVSNNEWREFIDSNGYKRPELWLSDGWDFIKKNNIKN